MIFQDMSHAFEPAGARHPSKPAKPSTRAAPTGRPFDPNDLSRRLLMVLAEQKATTEKKRKARAEAEHKERAAASTASQRGGASARIGATGHTALGKTGSQASRDKPKVKTAAKKTPTTQKGLSAEARGPKLSKVSPQPAKTTQQPSTTQPYVPREAATQFARTTTAVNITEGGGLAHKLSRQALKSHLASLSAGGRSSSVEPPEQTKSVRKSQSQRDRLFERSQQQHPRILEETTEIDEERDLRTHRHTFEGGFIMRAADRHPHDPRRSSTGDIFGDADRNGPNRESVLLIDTADVGDVIDPETAGEHRVDWTQSDEAKQKPREALRAKTSIWTLRGKFGNLTRHGREDKAAATQAKVDDPLSPKSPKSPRGGFS